MPERMPPQLLVACIFCVLHRAVSGSCTQFGQSCWGGFGKRSEGTADWYLARLLSQRSAPPSQLDERNIFGAENVVRGPVAQNLPQISGAQPRINRLEEAAEGLAPITIWEGATDPDSQQEAWTKMRLYQLLTG